MTLSTLINGEPWMTPQERELNHHIIDAIAQSLAEAGVRETALVTLRVNDIAATWLLARRLESALTPAEGEPAPCPTPAQANAIGRCRDRLRRAIKELEACCPRDAAPIRQSLIEQMHEAVRAVRANEIQDEPAAAGNDDFAHTDGQSQHHHHQAPPNRATHARATSDTNTPTHASTVQSTQEGASNPARPRPHPPHPSHAPQIPNPTGPAEPLPPNRATRRLQAREERRNRTGRSTMGTYRRTTPQIEPQCSTANTQNEENGSRTQRGGMSRPG